MKEMSNVSIYDKKLIEKAKTKLKFECLNCVANSLESIQSDYHRENMNFFANFSESEYKDREYIIMSLCDLAVSPYALQYKNYKKEFDLVKKARSEKNAECAVWVADNPISLQYPYHEEDMKLIVNAKSDGIAIALKNVACNEKSLLSGYHSETMSLIACAKSDDIAECISTFACSLQISFNYNNFIDLVATIEIDSIAYDLVGIVKGFSLFNADDYDLNSLQILARVNSEIEANSLFSILYNLNLSLSKKERFEKAVNFARKNHCNLKGINISSLYDDDIMEKRTSKVLKKAKRV